MAGRSKYAAIFEVATQPSHRRRGYASELLKVMIQEAQKAGAERVYLHASAMGKSVYEKVGFQSYPKGIIASILRDYYSLGLICYVCLLFDVNADGLEQCFLTNTGNFSVFIRDKYTPS